MKSLESIVDAKLSRRYVRWNISLNILAKDKLAAGKQLTSDENANLLRALLYKYGMDIDRHYEVEVCEHRDEFGEVVHCHYFMGIERTDIRWKSIKTNLLTGRWRA